MLLFDLAGTPRRLGGNASGFREDIDIGVASPRTIIRPIAAAAAQDSTWQQGTVDTTGPVSRAHWKARDRRGGVVAADVTVQSAAAPASSSVVHVDLQTTASSKRKD